MKKFRILVADSHEIARVGVRSIVSSHPRWEVCGEAADANELIGGVSNLTPDIVIMEPAMHGLDGLNAVREILQRVPDQKILAFTYCDSEVLARQALEAGVRGLLLKSDAATELRAAIEALMKGAVYFTRRISEMLLQGFRQVSGHTSQYARSCLTLTVREKEVLRAIAGGLSNRRISVLFGLTRKTVETHRSNIMRKLDLHSIADMVLYAVRNNILSVDDREIEVYSADGRTLNVAGRNSTDRLEEDTQREQHEAPGARSVAAA
jgi:DNA-binding NarL/FixJ family response regulator